MYALRLYGYLDRDLDGWDDTVIDMYNIIWDLIIDDVNMDITAYVVFDSVHLPYLILTKSLVPLRMRRMADGDREAEHVTCSRCSASVPSGTQGTGVGLYSYLWSCEPR